MDNKKTVTLKAMANKRKLCEGFNKGTCPKRQCTRNPPEDHRCNGKLPGKEVACAMFHPSTECTRCERR